MKLSNSAVDTYETCPMKYKLHYIERLRPTYTMSPLLFGIAIDEALNRMLLDKKAELTEEEQLLMSKTPLEIFREKMAVANINYENVDIAKSHKIDYYKSDLDLSLLDANDYKLIESSDFGNISLPTHKVAEFVEDCWDLIKQKKSLDFDMKIAYNYICWLSLNKKGEMLMDAYKLNILPEIVEVFTIQEEIWLPGENGNGIRGFIDYTAKFKDGVTRVCDNKTSSVKYKDDSVETSRQLAIYSEYKQNYECAFTVLNKKLLKREPRVKTQIVFGKISDDFLEKTFDNIGLIEYNIENGIFPPNKKACFSYGKRCAFLDKNGGCTNRNNIVCLKESNEENSKQPEEKA